MAKLTIDKIIDYLDGLSLADQRELLTTVKQRVIDNLAKAQSEAEEKASEIQQQLNSITGQV